MHILRSPSPPHDLNKEYVDENEIADKIERDAEATAVEGQQEGERRAEPVSERREISLQPVKLSQCG